MPKQKITNKKSTVKKQPGKLGRAVNWLKPTTPAKGMLLFVIVFAIAGGAYYAYKSSAQTLYVVHYPQADVSCYGSCARVTDTQGSSKSPVQAVRIDSDDSGIAPPAGIAVTTFLLAGPWNKFPSNTYIPTRLCAELKAEYGHDTTARMKIVLHNGRGGGDSGPFMVQNWQNNDYHKFCTPEFGAPGGQYLGDASVTNIGVGTGSGRLFVKSISLEGR